MGLRKHLTLGDLLIIGVAGSIGGAVFYGAQKAAAEAGPAGILAYALAPVLYFFIALTYIDLAMDYPEAGGPSRFAIYSHGQATNIINSVADLIWYLFIPPLEAYVFVALVVSEFYPGVINPATGNLTLIGGLIALALIMIMVPLNYYGIEVFTVSNKVVGSMKFALYAIMAIVFALTALKFNPYVLKNLTNYGGFMPYGVTGLFAAMPIAMFSFGGARTIPDFAEEIKGKRSIVPGLILTVVGQGVIYVTFAALFVLSVDWGVFHIRPGDWSSFLNISRNPYYYLAAAYKLPYMYILPMLYLILALFMVGYVYMGAGTRVMLAMARSKYVAGKIGEIHPRYAIPYWALIIFGLIGAAISFLFAPVPGLYGIVSDTTAAGYIGFAVNPIAMMVLRKQGASKYQVPAGWFVSATAFAISSLIVFWNGWPAVPYAVLLMTVVAVILAIIYRVKEGWLEATWYIGWIAFETLMAYIGSDGALNIIPFTWATAITAIISLAVFYPLGIILGLRQRNFEVHIKDLGGV
ncbi:amino acid permease-associated region [Caldivirga maquilingensis IC-167]|uniref:Amino acid permease-associated region n=1 Tax=Caldivirga maquilingensis (strain ATCC 700844 / DSM 13496 / JCM 10307 / IC-167) TaxID=397948 RepID=A8MDA2_CALMQ|nr:amino acid permease-associated region [Caldivirga maquilingensis IC-167]